MDISTIVMISCVLTGVTMTIMAIVAAFLLRFGSQGLMMLFNRLIGGLNQDKRDDDAQVESQTASRGAVSSGDALRRRARDMDFPLAQPAQTAPPQFGAQATTPTAFQAPMQPSLRARDTLQYTGGTPAQNFGTQPMQPNNAALSPSRPYQGGAMPARPMQSFPQQSGFQQPAPFQQNLPRPAAPQGFPQQSGFQQPAPLQGGFPPMPPQAGFGQQVPQQGGMTEYRPGLRRSGSSDESSGSLRANNRDSRRNDDQEIYDDDQGGFLSNLPL